MITQEQKMINQLKQAWQNTDAMNYDVIESKLKLMNKIVSNNPEYTALRDTLAVISDARIMEGGEI